MHNIASGRITPCRAFTFISNWPNSRTSSWPWPRCAQQAVETAVDAFLQRDKGLCKFVKQNEAAINTAQRELDEMAYELLAKEQPMAIDLRFILAVIKINGDLERIGDQSMGIARRTKEILNMEEVDLPGRLCRHGRVCRAHDSLGGAGAARWRCASG